MCPKSVNGDKFCEAKLRSAETVDTGQNQTLASLRKQPFSDCLPARVILKNDNIQNYSNVEKKLNRTENGCFRMTLGRRGVRGENGSSSST